MSRIYLRTDKSWGRTVEKGFDHPMTIAPVRLSHVLSRIDLQPPGGLLSREESTEREPVIPLELLETVSAGLSEALAAAGPDQEVVVMAVLETKRWGVFDHDYLTSFVAYIRDERLFLHFNHVGWEIPKSRDDRVPEPRAGRHPQRFRLYPGTALTLVDQHSLAIDWRDAVFAEASRVRVGPGGELQRREILMETPPDELQPVRNQLPDTLSPEQLRALADLEEARREGRITEAVYRTRRAEILGGR